MQKEIEKVLILGDSPTLNTGFGRVNRVAAQMFQRQGWKVASLAGLVDKLPEETNDGIEYFIPHPGTDPIGLQTIEDVVGFWEPDIVYMTSDPGTATNITMATPWTVPGVAYIPIEGEPITNVAWQNVLSGLAFLTCSNYGVDIVKKDINRDVDFAYHGIDHDVFRVNGARDYVRTSQFWDDKFVIMCVAQNVRRKQIPRLLEAVAILKHQYKQKDIILYLHTVPFQKYILDGWNLREVVAALDIADIVKFNPLMKEWKDSIPETGDVNGYPSLVDFYNAADLFVLPSQVEGFGLPIAEAMACGVPVLVTKYAAGWEVASPAGRGIPVNDWEFHKSGTRYANVNVQALAQEILRLKRNPKERARMSAAGLERVKDFTWDDFESKLIPLMRETYNGYQTWRQENQGINPGEEPFQQEVDIREGESEVSPEEG